MPGIIFGSTVNSKESKNSKYQSRHENGKSNQQHRESCRALAYKSCAPYNENRKLQGKSDDAMHRHLRCQNHRRAVVGSQDETITLVWPLQQSSLEIDRRAGDWVHHAPFEGTEG